MIKLAVSKRAEKDLRAIWRYIAADSLKNADNVLFRIEKKLQRLREFPTLGTSRDDIRPGARVLIEGSYILLYEYREAEAIVELVAVVHGRRDLPGLF